MESRAAAPRGRAARIQGLIAQQHAARGARRNTETASKSGNVGAPGRAAPSHSSSLMSARNTAATSIDAPPNRKMTLYSPAASGVNT